MENGETNLEAEQRFSRMASSFAKAHIKAKEFEGNLIHPTAIIGENVKMGKNNFIGANCIIYSNTIVGDNNSFLAFCSIGSEPEHPDYFSKPNKGVIIGNNNYFREFVTINAGCDKPTIIEDDIVVFSGAHIDHDCKIMRNAILSNNTVIHRNSIIGIFAFIGSGGVCKHDSRIGHYSEVGIMSISKTIPSFETWVGRPAYYVCPNEKWRQNFTKKDIVRITKEFNQEKL